MSKIKNTMAIKKRNSKKKNYYKKSNKSTKKNSKNINRRRSKSKGIKKKIRKLKAGASDAEKIAQFLKNSGITEESFYYYFYIDLIEKSTIKYGNESNNPLVELKKQIIKDDVTFPVFFKNLKELNEYIVERLYTELEKKGKKFTINLKESIVKRHILGFIYENEKNTELKERIITSLVKKNDILLNNEDFLNEIKILITENPQNNNNPGHIYININQLKTFINSRYTSFASYP